MEDNFATKVGHIISIAGVVGGLISGKVFEVSSVVGTYYTRVETSYNWGLAVGCIVSSLIVGALFVTLGNIQDRLDKNSYYFHEMTNSLKKDNE